MAKEMAAGFFLGGESKRNVGFFLFGPKFEASPEIGDRKEVEKTRKAVLVSSPNWIQSL
jgi:hypothetical protein